MSKIEIPSDFDWEYYLEINPDVAKVPQYNSEEGAKTHWRYWGNIEHRKYKRPITIKNAASEYNENSIQKIDVEKILTVVIPNKLGQSPIITINSLYNQTFKNFDIIIINDLNDNANKARNEGLSLVNTRYVLFSDNDIDWVPDALQNMINCLEMNPEVSFAYGICNIDEYVVGGNKWDAEALKKTNYISMMSIIRTTDHPGFDESIERFQDWDLWLTMSNNGKIGKNIEKRIFSTKSDKNGITKNSISSKMAREIILRKHSKISLNNNDFPIFSIITPSFNSKYIKETIQSVKNQTFESFEHIIVDDHSTDNSVNVIQNNKHDKLKFYSRPDNLSKNANSCRNYGIEKCTGKYIIFLDADDILSPKCLEERFKSMNYDSDMNIYKMGRFKDKIPTTDIEIVNPKEKYENHLDNYLSYWNLWPITSITWKKDFLIKIGKFDENLNRFQDFDLHLRALLNYANIEKYPHDTVDCYYRESDFLKSLSNEKKIIILNSALHLIKKYEEIHIDFYKYFYDYLLKYYENVMTDSIKKYLVDKSNIVLKDPSEKLKILLLPDTNGWAFDNIASAIIKYNPYPDKIEYHKEFLRQIKNNNIKIDLDKWDYVYLMFEGDKYVPDNKEKIIRGCYSAHWLENTANTPEYLGNKFSKNRGVVFVNEILEKNIYPFLSEDIDRVIIPDSSDENKFYPIANQKQNEFTVIFVGNPERKIKNYPIIQKICSDANVKLMTVTNIPNENLVYEYNKADICINFSDSEGGPQTFLESSLCNVPMLIRDNNYLSHKIPCFVGKTEQDFINIINQLKLNRNKCVEIGEKARETVLKNFTYKITAKKFGDFFLDINNVDKNKNKKVDISFIIPIRGREEHIDGLEYNIKNTIKNYSWEIIYVNQDDDKLFKRGQLCNIGFKKSKGNIIVFQDVDIRHLNSFDPKKLLEKYKTPFVAFDEITQINEFNIGEYEILHTEKRPSGFGACAVFYRKDFEESGGFSNLIFGWGAEDNIINDRVNFQRLPQKLGHVFHKSMRSDKSTLNSEWHKNNVKMWRDDKNRIKKNDGYAQTTCDINRIIKTNNIQVLNVKNIGISYDYEYTEIYNIVSKVDLKNE